MVTLGASFPSKVFLTTTFLAKVLVLSLVPWGLPKTMLSHLFLLIASCEPELSSHQVFTRKDWLPNCMSRNFNQPSSIDDCFCPRKTLQSLIAWEKELCHLQYALFFISSIGGIMWDNLTLPLLSNLSNILSHLVTLKSKLHFFLHIFASELQRRTSMWFNLNGPNKLSYVNLLRLIIRTTMITSISWWTSFLRLSQANACLCTEAKEKN